MAKVTNDRGAEYGRSGKRAVKKNSGADHSDEWKMSTGLKVQMVTWILGVIVAIVGILVVRPYLP
jgi:hypothetical protein